MGLLHLYEVRYGRTLTLPVSSDFSVYEIWITKQNYRPKQFKVYNRKPLDPIGGELENVNENNSMVSVLPNPVENIANIDFSKEICVDDSYLLITSTLGLECERISLKKGETNAIIDLSNFKTGNYIVALIENGMKIDSKLIIKK